MYEIFIIRLLTAYIPQLSLLQNHSLGYFNKTVTKENSP